MDKNFNNPIKYKDFGHNPLTLNEVENIYKVNGINQIHVDLYSDFVQYLCDLVMGTYLGDEHHTDIKHQVEHFTWCWNKTIDVFAGMGYIICNDDKIYAYFQSFFLEIFYATGGKNEGLVYSIKQVWEYIFSYHVIKSKFDVDNFLEVYYLFNRTVW